MAAPWDGRLSTYLGKGLASARPATPNVQPGLFCLWFSTDTDEVSMWDGSGWVDNIFLTDAPSDTDAYVRKGGEWVTVTGTDVGLPETVTPGDVVVVNPDGSLGTATPVPGTAPVVNGATKFRVVTVTAGADGGTAYSELGWYNRNQAHIIPISWAASSTTTGDVNDLGDNTLGSSGWSTTEGVGAWVEVEFATPTLLNSVVVDAYEGGGTNNTPVSWKFQFYDVGTAAWIDIGTPWTRSPPWDGSGTEVRVCFPIDLFTPTAPVAVPVLTEAGGTATGPLEVPSDPLDAGWNGDNSVPTRNDIFDLIDTDGALTANSDFKVASQKAVKTYVANQVAGLWQFQGLLDASGNPNYPAGLVGDTYLINFAGKVGGASGLDVEPGDLVVCIADNAGGTQAAVGAGWSILQGNILSVAPPDADYGDVTVTSGGTVWTVDNSAITYAKIQNISATSRVLGRKTAGAGVVEELTLSDLLDFIGSAAQGDILYRGASAWARLAAGTAGYILQTNGAAPPTWVTKPSVVAGGSSGVRPWYWAPPAASLFTSIINFGAAATLTDDSDTGLTSIMAAPAGVNLRNLAYVSVPSGNWDLKVRMQGIAMGSGFGGCGIMAMESSSNKLYSLERLNGDTIQLTGATAGLNGGRTAVTSNTGVDGSVVWFRMARVGTNILTYISHDGKTWLLYRTEVMTTRFTTEPDRAGLFILQDRSTGLASNYSCDFWSLT